MGWLCIAVAAVLCISFVIWRNRTIYAADIIDFDGITKVEIGLNDQCLTLTEEGDIKDFTDILGSMKLKKMLNPNRDGYVFAIDIYHKNNIINELVVYRNIIIDGQHYKCDREYCTDILKRFYE